MTQEEKDKAYLKMAQQWATNSYAIRLNVGWFQRNSVRDA